MLYPAIRAEFDKGDVDEKEGPARGALGEALADAKKAAPTRPHPRSPDEPPGNIIAGAGAAMIDKVRDTGRKAGREALAGAGR